MPSFSRMNPGTPMPMPASPSPPQDSRSSAIEFTMSLNIVSRPAAGLLAVARRSRICPARSTAAALRFVPPKSSPIEYSGMNSAS